MNSTLLDLSNGFANAVAGQSVVAVNEGGRAGVSGTIWRDDLVVTAEHTIRDQQELTIELPGDKTSTATVVGRDTTTDIALLRLKDTAPAATDFIDAQQIRVGQLRIGYRAAWQGWAGRKSWHRQRPLRRLAHLARRSHRPVVPSGSHAFHRVLRWSTREC